MKEKVLDAFGVDNNMEVCIREGEFGDTNRTITIDNARAGKRLSLIASEQARALAATLLKAADAFDAKPVKKLQEELAWAMKHFPVRTLFGRASDEHEGEVKGYCIADGDVYFITGFKHGMLIRSDLPIFCYVIVKGTPE